MPQPNKIPLAFAASGDKNSIPESTETTGLASWREGFPAITSTPFSEGGIAPKRADFNGIFNALSLAIIWQQQGGFYAYSNAVDYEVGNVVIYNNDLYKCRTTNGPSTSVKAPTDTTVWGKVMTAADAAALYLPLSGGTMTGVIKSTSNPALAKPDNSSAFTIAGGRDTASTSGAKAIFYGADNTNSGHFNIQAGNTGGYKQLIGKPDGTLSWDNKEISTVETGTFTPTMRGGSTAGSFTYTTQSGTYMKFNKLCFVEFIVVGKVVTAPTGSVYIGGLPFAASTANQSLVLNMASSTSGLFDAAPVWVRISTNPANNVIWGVNANTNVVKGVNFGTLAVDTEIFFRASGAYRTA